MTTLFKMIGSSIGPAVAGLYMQTNQAIVEGVDGSYPSPDSYNLIFITLALTSVIPVGLAIFIGKKTYKLPLHSHKNGPVENPSE